MKTDYPFESEDTYQDASLAIKDTLQDADLAERNKVGFLALSIFITGILYYCYAYLLRVFPSVMEPNLLTHFHITASAFGNLAAFYYYAYAPMQLPVGVAIDRYGARRSLIFASLISVLGITVFTTSHSLYAAELGRFLIGFGSAFAYVTVLKLATTWLPSQYFATATGIATGSGMLSAVFTDIYLTRLVQEYGYKAALYFSIAIGVILFALIVSLVRDKTKGDGAETQSTASPSEEFAISYKQLGSYLLLLAKNPQMWIIGLIGALMYLPASVFLDIWGIPYLKAVYHLTPEQAGFGVSATLLGWIAASPIIGALSDKLGTRKYPLVISTFSATIISSIIFFTHGLPISMVYILLFTLGLTCASHPLCFTMSKENNTSKISGTSIAFANCLIMLGGVVFQPVVGKLLDYNWNGMMLHGMRVYSIGDYTSSLSILPIGLFIAGLLTLLLKETFQKNLD